MTTATTRSRPLKVFRIERRMAILSDELYALVATGTHHNQGVVLVAAPTKAAAVARLRERGFPTVSPGHVSVATGDDVTKLIAAKLLTQFGDLVAYRDSITGHVVALVRGDDVAIPVGAWRYDRAERTCLLDLSSPAVCQDCDWRGPETHRLFEDRIRCPRCRSVDVYVFDQPRSDA